MKPGYTIQHRVNPLFDNIIQVVNSEAVNRIYHFGWIKGESARKLSGSMTIGIWKRKTPSNK
jgi:hypothetical protein